MTGKRVCEAERSSSEIISTFPQTILETILCLLPTKEAARTSVLSKEWRYKWTTIPKLEFYLSQVSKRITEDKQVQGKNLDKICKLFYDLHQILLSYLGPIHDFTLDIDLWDAPHDSSGLDQIVLLLSKNHTVKKLSLFGPDDPIRYNLPITVFSLHHLTDLDLFSIDINHQPIFNGFGSLKSLILANVGISTKTLLHLLSNNPSLKSLTLLIGASHLGDENCTINELLECLPVIEHLTTSGYFSEWLDLDSVPQELPTSLFHLKYLCFQQMCFEDGDGYGLAFLFELIKCSPNLEKIKLQVEWGHGCYEEYSIVWEEYSDVWLEHLNELEIECFSNSKPEMKFVKFILAKSPKLKKVSLTCIRNQDLEMFKTLLQAPRASPVIITVK